jgi:hypothetical protein
MNHVVEGPQFDTAGSEEEALERLHDANMTDGLPVVIPTRARVEAMMLASGLDGDVSLGKVGPSMADATVDVVAANAVMAGCLPDHFPVVVAAVKAIADPEFDLTETQVTTHPVTPLLIVNGPARHHCGIACGTGAFGPGFRANAAIGRAIRLVMMNIGGGRPGISDNATLGSPAKFSFCAGENEEESPWPPLHVSRGWHADQSTVTAITVEGPHSVICSPMPDAYVDIAIPAAIRLISGAVFSLGSNSTYVGKGDIAVIINPSTAKMLSDAGYTREKLQEAIVNETRYTRGFLRQHNPLIVPPGPDEEPPPRRDPASLIIVVSGSIGGYVMVCPTLGISKHHHPAVTKEIELNQFCELPVFNPQ